MGSHDNPFLFQLTLSSEQLRKFLNFQLFSVVLTVVKGLLIPFQAWLVLTRLIQQMPVLALIAFYTNGQFWWFL